MYEGLSWKDLLLSLIFVGINWIRKSRKWVHWSALLTSTQSFFVLRMTTQDLELVSADGPAQFCRPEALSCLQKGFSLESSSVLG